MPFPGQPGPAAGAEGKARRAGPRRRPASGTWRRSASPARCTTPRRRSTTMRRRRGSGRRWGALAGGACAVPGRAGACRAIRRRAARRVPGRAGGGSEALPARHRLVPAALGALREACRTCDRPGEAEGARAPHISLAPGATTAAAPAASAAPAVPAVRQAPMAIGSGSKRPARFHSCCGAAPTHADRVPVRLSAATPAANLRGCNTAVTHLPSAVAVSQQQGRNR